MSSVLAKLAVNISANTAEFNQKLSATQKSISGFQNAIGSVAKLAGGLFVADRLIEFGKQVFNVTAEFQKFEAVLTNTLGSNSAANAALRQITEFAAKTPFQVNELTGSFVKLANQGFVPTLNQMRSLGDLASAMGKSFDQLTEAIIDAQTGEFERLKEFGIRAQKQGDKVTFTFKGVKTQVDFTADSIRQYILSLGEVEGVTGGMEAQSKTLGGTLSNLADAWDQLQLSIGKLIEGDGMVSAFLNNLAAGAKAIADALGGPTREELEKTRDLLAQIRSKSWAEKDMATWERARAAWQEADERLRAMVDGETKLAEIQNSKSTPAVQSHTTAIRSLNEAMAEWDRSNSIFAQSFDPSSLIKDKTGADFLFDSGALVEMANAGANALKGLNGELQVNSNELTNWLAQVQATAQIAADAFAMDLGPAVSGVVADIASALGSAAEGMGNFGADILRSIGGFMQQFGASLIALGIGKISLEKFSGPAMIAAGFALTAAGGALQASAQRSAKSIGGGSSHQASSSRASERFNANTSVQDSNPQLVTVLKGEDLWIILQNYQANNRLTRG